jgi:hypothetical protein
MATAFRSWFHVGRSDRGTRWERCLWPAGAENIRKPSTRPADMTWQKVSVNCTVRRNCSHCTLECRQVDRSTGRQVDRSLTGPWQVTCAVERSAVCQVHKVLEQRFNLDGSPMAAMARSRDQSETCCLEASRDIFAILCQSIAIFTDFSTYSSTGLPCYWLEWYAESHFQPANCKCCLCLLILGLKGVTMFVSHSGWFWYALVDMNCQHVLDHAETEVDLTSEMRPERCEDFAAFFRYQSSQFSQSEINLQSWTSEINLHNFHNLSHAQL